MHLGQIRKDGAAVAAIFDGNRARPIPAHSMADLIHRAEAENIPLGNLAAQLASRHDETASPILPLYPAEVWGCGCTYETSASFRDGEHGTREGMYAYVYREPRPEIFFKGTARVCVGPGQTIGLRSDSKFTAPEPELALILGSKGKILGYTLANDVSAWDIERENTLYLTQSKIFNSACALGPFIVTTESIEDPYNLEISCSIFRGESRVFSGAASTRRLHRTFETMIQYLYVANNVPAGSVLLTGTGIIVAEGAALNVGDRVDISTPEIGTLSNLAAQV